VAEHIHFLRDGVSFWWNDEGETQWFTYHWWVSAQSAQWAAALPGERFWSLTRSFTPGLQRFATVTWTGVR